MSKSGDTPAPKRSRLIHVRLDAETHRRLRVATAERDATIQDWVATLIERALDRVVSENSNSLWRHY